MDERMDLIPIPRYLTDVNIHSIDLDLSRFRMPKKHKAYNGTALMTQRLYRKSIFKYLTFVKINVSMFYVTN